LLKNIISILKNLRNSKEILKDAILLKTFYHNYRRDLFSLPIIIYPEVHLFIGSNAKIIHNGGRLQVGRRWGVGRFKQSEFVVADDGILEINDDFEIYTGCSVVIDSGAKLSLGKGGLNLGVRMAVFNSISIGNNCFISENVTIRDSDNHRITGRLKTNSSPIIFGNNVLIGINATILKGVTIGNGAVVAANSLVNKSVPPNTLVGGVPAKIIKENIKWEL
jgi:acetyltransferase-like isoleucine patch superfamily enzyme